MRTDTAKYKILYVDDEQDNLDVFESTFWKDYHVHLALSAKEALGILNKVEINLIITDQRMPMMTGVELLEQTATKYPDTVRLMLTGFSDSDAIADAINKGKISQYLTKPWEKIELMEKLDSSLESFRLKDRDKALLQDWKIKNQKLTDLNGKLERMIKKVIK